MAKRNANSQPPVLEIQIHPGNIRRGVWYFFLSRRRLALWIGGLGVVGLFLAFNLIAAPGVVFDLMSRRDYKQQLASRVQEGERLKEQVERLTDLSVEAEDLHLKMSRIYLAYGLENDESEGQGGFPFTTPPVPDSIYASVIRHGNTLSAGIGERLEVVRTFVEEVQEFEQAHSDQVHTTPSISPLRGDEYVLTSPFGLRRSPFTKQMSSHSGVDLAAPEGTPILATADAVVVFAGRYPIRRSVSWWRYGNMVALSHGDRFVTIFGHCEELLVKSGQEVEQGEQIATVGNTGWSTSPHLHYEVRRWDDDEVFRPVDPRVYILDHRWRDEERLLVRARQAPTLADYEPLPPLIGK